MRIISSLLFLPLFAGFLMYGAVCKKDNLNKWQRFLKKHIAILIILLCTNAGCFAMTFLDNNKASILIEKEDYTGEEKEVALQLKKDGQRKEIALNISPRTYSEKEALEKMEEAFACLEDHLKGDNESLSHVTSDLDLHLDEKRYPFEIECVSSQYSLVNNQGIVQNDEARWKELGYENQDEGIPVTIKITLLYGSYKKEKDFEVVVYKKEQTTEEELFSKVIRTLEQIEKKAAGEKYVELPTMVEGVFVAPLEEHQIKAIHLWIFGLVLSGLLLLREYELEKEREKKHLEDLQRSYPWFVNELVLLLGSGMQIKNIFFLLVNDYKNQKNTEACHGALINELETACHSFEIGMSEETIYYRLGRRLKLPCYIKIMTLLEQNVKKGSKGMTAMIEQEEHNALEARKNMAKRYGEEAGTKLLGPMVLLLLIIMLIIMFPAFMSFQ